MVQLDKMFRIIANHLIKKYKLKKNGKVGICINSNNLGDVYFLLSAYHSGQKYENVDYVIFANKSNKNFIYFLDIFKNANVTFDVHFINVNLEFLFNNASKTIISRYKNLFEGYFCCRNKILFTRKSPDYIRKRLSRPKYSQLKCLDFFQKNKIEPGKAIFIIPLSGYNKSLPDIFWQISLSLFKNLGFTCIINSNKNKKFGDDVLYFMPKIYDIVPFANYCGYVFSIRSGLSEIIAAESTAHITILDVDPESLFKFYPFIDNQDGHIKIIKYNSINTTGFYILDKFINDICETNNKSLKASSLFYYSNKFISSKIKTPEYGSDIRKANVEIFSRPTPHRQINDFFTEVKYATILKGNIVYLFLFFSYPLNYKIHLALINIDINHIVNRQYFIANNPANFTINKSGNYKIFVKIYHPITLSSIFFDTQSFYMNIEIKDKLASCDSYSEYLQLIKDNGSNFIVFIASKDTPINQNLNHKLYLDEFGLTVDIKKSFRHSFIAIIENGKIIYEEINKDATIRHDYVGKNFTAHIVSEGYNVYSSPNCSASIKIWGKEYAVNTRGLNFVVWDAVKNLYVDSVAWDTFGDFSSCRMNENFRLDI